MIKLNIPFIVVMITLVVIGCSKPIETNGHGYSGIWSKFGIG